VWVWIDGSIEVKASIPYLVKNWLGYDDIVAFEHPDRNCVYDEATTVKGKFYDYPEVIDRQMDKYRNEGFPKKIGLSETKIVIRRNNKKVRKFNRDWFYEIMTGSVRCQLSFDYCVWKNKLRLKQVPPFQRGQKALIYHKHGLKREETRYGMDK